GVRQVTSTDQAMELLVGLTKSTRPSWTKRSPLKIPTEWIVPYAPPPGGAACAHRDHDRSGCETAATTAISHGWIRDSSPPSPVRPGWRSSTSPPLRYHVQDSALPVSDVEADREQVEHTARRQRPRRLGQEERPAEKPVRRHGSAVHDAAGVRCVSRPPPAVRMARAPRP